MYKTFLLFLGATFSLFLACCSSDEDSSLTQSPNQDAESKLYSDYSMLAASNSNELFESLGIGSNNSRSEGKSLLAYLLSLSNEELDSLKTVYPVSEENDVDEQYDKAIDYLMENYPLEVVTNFISVTNSYFEMGGHNKDYIFSNIKDMPESMKNITIGIAAYFDEYTDGVQLLSSRSFGCKDMLALELGGMLVVDFADAAMGGAIGGAVGEGFAIYNISTTDLATVVNALAKYRWCERTGVFL